MIGILFLVGIVVWLAVAVMLSLRIPRWVGMTRHTVVVSILLFPIVLTAPFADSLIGQWQFNRLCEREAVVTLSPDWEKVKRARDNGKPIRDLNGYVIPIQVQAVELVDLDSENSILNVKAFHTKGGFLMRHGLGLGLTDSCWPPNWVQVMNQIDSDKLIKQGKSK